MSGNEHLISFKLYSPFVSHVRHYIMARQIQLGRCGIDDNRIRFIVIQILILIVGIYLRIYKRKNWTQIEKRWISLTLPIGSLISIFVILSTLANISG